ncbi:MAG TPA: GNAT family N-acetyltransferase [Planctomycetota bacterium]
MSGTTMRLVTANDFPAIAAITNHYIRTTAIHFAYDDVTADELRSLWRQHEAMYPWLVAETAGAVAGFAKSGAFRTRTAYHWTTETGIYLAPEQRGRGLGRLLYTRLLAVLRAQGFHSAIGGIALPNDVSVRLHENLGFEPCGVVRRAGRKFDRWHDVGFWQLALQPAAEAPRELLRPDQAFQATARAFAGPTKELPGSGFGG